MRVGGCHRIPAAPRACGRISRRVAPRRRRFGGRGAAEADAAPSSTKRSTVARPMPDAPPVTTATSPSSRPTMRNLRSAADPGTAARWLAWRARVVANTRATTPGRRANAGTRGNADPRYDAVRGGNVLHPGTCLAWGRRGEDRTAGRGRPRSGRRTRHRQLALLRELEQQQAQPHAGPATARGEGPAPPTRPSVRRVRGELRAWRDREARPRVRRHAQGEPGDHLRSAEGIRHERPLFVIQVLRHGGAGGWRRLLGDRPARRPPPPGRA